jgi:pimeloyl-ACP methyl ester carboxylesterase
VDAEDEVSLLRLGDGRNLAYQEWGDPRGSTVLGLHATPGSRLERFPDSATLSRLGVHLVTFDRPGYGLSDPLPGRTLLDCADDVVRLADHLGADEFTLAGMAGGGPFVLATAWAYAGRVRGAAISCGLGPLDRPGALSGMTPGAAAQFHLAAHHPDLLEAALAGGRLAPAVPEHELATLEAIPGLTEMVMEDLAAVTGHGWAGVVADDLALAGPWEFPLAEITVPLMLWHGDLDTLVPFGHSEYVASQVPGAEVHRCAGQGHFAMFGHQEEILTRLTRRAFSDRAART